MQIYVIESRWSGDSPHTEFATMAVEGHKNDPDPMDKEPKELTEDDLENIRTSPVFKSFVEIAAHQNGCPTDLEKKIAIHRVSSHEEKRNEKTGELELVFKLKPILFFDEKGDPVPAIGL